MKNNILKFCKILFQNKHITINEIIMKIELNGNATLLQEQITLNTNCEFNAFCSLDEINRGKIIKIKTVHVFLSDT